MHCYACHTTVTASLSGLVNMMATTMFGHDAFVRACSSILCYAPMKHHIELNVHKKAFSWQPAANSIYQVRLQLLTMSCSALTYVDDVPGFS